MNLLSFGGFFLTGIPSRGSPSLRKPSKLVRKLCVYWPGLTLLSFSVVLCFLPFVASSQSITLGMLRRQTHHSQFDPSRFMSFASTSTSTLPILNFSTSLLSSSTNRPFSLPFSLFPPSSPSHFHNFQPYTRQEQVRIYNLPASWVFVTTTQDLDSG